MRNLFKANVITFGKAVARNHATLWQNLLECTRGVISTKILHVVDITKTF
jgi:hypothetical protein